MKTETKSALISAVATLIAAACILVVPTIKAIKLFGSLEARILSLEEGTWINSVREKLEEEIADAVGEEIQRAISSQSPSPATPTAAFTSPQNGDGIPREIMARGTSSNIDTSLAIWIFVYSHKASQYFPAAREADVQIDGSWSSAIRIGDGNTVSGEGFDLVITKNTSQAVSLIHTHLDGPIGGMDNVPQGSMLLDRIEVACEQP